MPPQARIGDSSLVPADAHGCPACPHPAVGPAVAGSANVLTNGLPSVRVGDPGIHAACCGPNTWNAKIGSATVLINGRPAHRLGDQVRHCGGMGQTMQGSPNVIVGGPPSSTGGPGGPTASPAAPSAVPGMSKDAADAAISQALKDQKAMLEEKKSALKRWNEGDKKNFKKWFGSDSDADRDKIKDRIDKMIKLNKSMTPKNFKAAKDNDPGLFAQVYPDDKKHTVELGQKFKDAPSTGTNSKAGTLSHEMSHFNDIGGTDDHVYGPKASKKLALKDHNKALNNADNFEYYLENAP